MLMSRSKTRQSDRLYCLGPRAGARPTLASDALWQPRVLSSDPTFGVQANRFGFTIAWAADRIVVGKPARTWPSRLVAGGTNTLTGGSAYFSDPEAAEAPARFYRLRASRLVPKQPLDPVPETPVPIP